MPFTALIGNKKTANANDDFNNKTLYSIISNGTYYSQVNSSYSTQYGDYYFNYEIYGNFQPCNFVKATTTNANALEYYDFRNLAVERVLEERVTEPFFERYYDLPIVSQYSFLGDTSNRFQTYLEFIESDIITLEFNNVLIPALPYDLDTNINNVLNRLKFTYSGLRGGILDTYCLMEYYVNDDFNNKVSLISYVNNLNAVDDSSFIYTFDRFSLPYEPSYVKFGDKYLYVLDKLTFRFYLDTSRLKINAFTYALTDGYGFLSFDNSTTLINDYETEKGFALGYESGYNDGLSDNENINPFAILTGGVESFLKIELFPNFYVYSLLLFALGFALFGLLIKYALGG